MLPPDGHQDAVTRLPDGILPVMDLLRGQVVHAVAGHRKKYLPLRSCWTTSANDPLLLAAAFRDRWGVSEFYLADLDALERQGSNQAVIECLLKDGYKIWLDAAVQSAKDALKWLDRGVSHVIVATETLQSLASLQDMLERVDPKKIVVSLDLCAGQVQCADVSLLQITPIDIVDKLVALGIQYLIILDVASVGTSQGPKTLQFCELVKTKYPDLALITGGGVRDLHDIQCCLAAGVQRVLVSTWLHALP